MESSLLTSPDAWEQVASSSPGNHWPPYQCFAPNSWWWFHPFSWLLVFLLATSLNLNALWISFQRAGCNLAWNGKLLCVYRKTVLLQMEEVGANFDAGAVAVTLWCKAVPRCFTRHNAGRSPIEDWALLCHPQIHAQNLTYTSKKTPSYKFAERC